MDVDECTDVGDICTGRRCVNTLGSYSCVAYTEMTDTNEIDTEDDDGLSFGDHVVRTCPDGYAFHSDSQQCEGECGVVLYWPIGCEVRPDKICN